MAGNAADAGDTCTDDCRNEYVLGRHQTGFGQPLRFAGLRFTTTTSGIGTANAIGVIIRIVDGDLQEQRHQQAQESHHPEPTQQQILLRPVHGAISRSG